MVRLYTTTKTGKLPKCILELETIRLPFGSPIVPGQRTETWLTPGELTTSM